MDQSLERRIRGLYAGFYSPEDQQGRSFVPLADAYRRAGDLLRARLLLEEGLRRHPDFASAHVVAMRIARDVSDHAGALAATRRVLELDPGNAEARRVLAKVGPLVEDAPATGPGDDGDAELPDESWMAGDAGVWAAGTDSGLASVDPAALEAEEERAVAAAAGPEPAAVVADSEPALAAGREPAAVADSEPAAEAEEQSAVAAEVELKPAAVADSDPAAEVEPEPAPVAGVEDARPAFAGPGEDEGARVPERGARGGARPTGIQIETPAAASGAVEDAGIYTRTMGRLYERQGLHAQAIAVYERLIESEPGDEALVRRLKRLRRQPAAEAPGGAPVERVPDAGSPGIEATGAGARADDQRFGTGGDGSASPTGEAEAVPGRATAKAPDVVPVPGGSLDIVPIEALAPDAPAPGAREGTP